MILNLAVQCSGFEMLRASSIHPTAEQYGGRGGGGAVCGTRMRFIPHSGNGRIYTRDD